MHFFFSVRLQASNNLGYPALSNHSIGANCPLILPFCCHRQIKWRWNRKPKIVNEFVIVHCCLIFIVDLLFLKWIKTLQWKRINKWFMDKPNEPHTHPSACFTTISNYEWIFILRWSFNMANNKMANKITIIIDFLLFLFSVHVCARCALCIMPAEHWCLKGSSM